MSILLENFLINGTGTLYDGTMAFYFTESLDLVKKKVITLFQMHPDSLESAKNEANGVSFNWWANQVDSDNAQRIRNYFGMQRQEKELIKLYISKTNQNTLNRIKAFINHNIQLVDFFLKNVNYLYWSNPALDGKGGNPGAGLEPSGLTLEDCTDLCLPAIRDISKIYATIMESSQPHKIISSLLHQEFEKDAIEYKVETGNLLKAVNPTKKSTKKKKGKKTD